MTLLQSDSPEKAGKNRTWSDFSPEISHIIRSRITCIDVACFNVGSALRGMGLYPEEQEYTNLTQNNKPTVVAEESVMPTEEFVQPTEDSAKAPFTDDGLETLRARINNFYGKSDGQNV